MFILKLKNCFSLMFKNKDQRFIIENNINIGDYYYVKSRLFDDEFCLLKISRILKDGKVILSNDSNHGTWPMSPRELVSKLDF